MVTGDDILEKMRFIVIGGQKCGTTWVDRTLNLHPQVYTPDVKETGFFSYYYHKGLDYYAKAFSNSGKKTVLGEVTGFYTESFTYAERIYETFGHGIKIILLVRNPIDAIVSAHNHMLHYKSDYPSVNDLIEKTAPDNGYYMRWMFFAHIKKYLDLSENKMQPKVFFFEDMIEDKKTFIREIFSYLGVTSIELSDDINTPANVAKSLRFPFLNSTMHNVYVFIRKNRMYSLRSLIEKTGIKPLLYKELVENKKLNLNNKHKLIQIYRDDIISLSEYTGRDLSHWLVV